MRSHAKAASVGSTSRRGGSRGLFGLACLCVLGLAAFLGSGAPAATAADACPNEAFRQGAGASLPDCRAYEQVSPVDKSGYDVLGYQPPYFVSFTVANLPASESGDALLFYSLGSFAGNPTGGGLTRPNFYVAQRGPAGWSTRPGAPRGTEPGGGIRFFTAASDLSVSWLTPTQGAFEPEPNPAEGVRPYYTHENFTGETHLAYSDVGFFLDEAPVAGSADLSHVVFRSEAALIDDPAVQPFGMKVYEYADGEIRLVSRQPGDNEPFAAETAPAGLGTGGLEGSFVQGFSADGAGAISADGNEIFFETPSPTVFNSVEDSALIYRRSNGTTTELASPSQRTPVDPEGPKGKRFMRATPDGDRVFFTSAELLTDDANTGPTRAGNDLYRYDFAAGDLIDISATPGGDGARVQGVVGVSDDGSRVYYVALGQVVPGEGTEGERNLYLWEDDGSPGGSTRFVTTLAAGEGTEFNDSANWASGGDRKSSRITPDGRYLLLTSRASLTGYDSSPIDPTACQTNGAPAPCPEVFRYDAEANGGSGELVCVSCAPGGPPVGPPEIPKGTNTTVPRAMSDDGRYVFFNSPDPLVPEDTNEKVDAYQWKDGELHLLSTGKSTTHSQVVEATPDGSKAFIATRSPLVPQDTDHNVDMYVASIGGGLVSQQAIQRPSCEGEACRDAGSRPPLPANPLTPAFTGAGNATPKVKRCGKGKRKVKGRCVRKHKQQSHKRHNKANSKRGGSK